MGAGRRDIGGGEEWSAKGGTGDWGSYDLATFTDRDMAASAPVTPPRLFALRSLPP